MKEESLSQMCKRLAEAMFGKRNTLRCVAVKYGPRKRKELVHLWDSFGTSICGALHGHIYRSFQEMGEKTTCKNCKRIFAAVSIKHFGHVIGRKK